jgi:hypothetical protein
MYIGGAIVLILVIVVLFLLPRSLFGLVSVIRARDAKAGRYAFEYDDPVKCEEGNRRRG